MLFDFKDNNVYDLDIDLDYNNLNLPKNKYEKIYNKRDDINLETGFFLGNIFSDSYKPYKNYKPKKINAYSEQQKLLVKLQELDFILNDLNLYGYRFLVNDANYCGDSSILNKYMPSTILLAKNCTPFFFFCNATLMSISTNAYF